MQKIFSTLLTVVVAVGGSALVWVAANLVFNQVRYQWRRFSAIAFAFAGLVIGVLFSGNRITKGSEGGFLEWVWLPLVLAVICSAIGIVLESSNDARKRQIIGVAAAAIVGLGIALLVQEKNHPGLDIAALIGWTVGGAVVFGGISLLRKKTPVNSAFVGAALGSILGGWGAADLGGGSVGEAIVVTLVPAVLIGARLGATSNPDLQGRAKIDQKSRAIIFLAPALLFVFIALVVPTVRTFYLSFLDQDSEKFVKLQNYSDTLNDEGTIDTSQWTNMFTSKLFIFGVVALLIAVAVGVVAKKRTGRAVEIGNPTVGPLLLGSILVAFAVFTSVRGTFANNLWWVATVVFAATAMGLAIAVLADNVRSEKIAKAFIFMPLALSLVGASVIWRFMYVPRDTSQIQTGTLNGLWVGLGRLSTGSGLPTIIVGAVVGAAVLALLVRVGRILVTKKEPTQAIVPGIGLLIVGWFFVRYTAILGGGIGGFAESDNGEFIAKPISFINESPFNNFWLMVVLIWIQTGFAMVILSAAIKAVPDELLEAARVDGGTPSQIFWRITLPQVSTTIGVVVTTLIVLVMKVFDIVKVMTNGNFGTQVLANDMYNQAFQFGNKGRGAALAIILFLSVLPVMFYNIRRMQKDN